MNERDEFKFAGFQIGAVISSVLLAGAIRLFVATVTDPISAMFVAFWNSQIVHAVPSAFPLQTVWVSWMLVAYEGISAIALLLLAVKLGAWVSKEVPAPR